MKHVRHGPSLLLVFIMTALLTIVVSAGRDDRLDDREPPSVSPELAPDSVVGAELRELVADVAAYRLCEYLRGRFLALTAQGAVAHQSAAPVEGNLLIQECTVEQADTQRLRIRAAGIGWRWIARKRERIGATFEVDEYLKADLALFTVGTIDFAYEMSGHTARVELVPTQPAQLDLTILNDVEVKTESVWASIVGAGARVIGAAPGRRVRRIIRRRGTHRLQAVVSRGVTVIADLCSGQQYLQLGSPPPGRIPPADTLLTRPFLTRGTAVIHEHGMLFAGPFETDEPVTASLEILRGQSMRAAYVCEAQARQLAEAYVDGEAVPAIEQPIAEQTVRGDAPVSLTVGADPGCRLVLVMRGPEQQSAPVELTYTVTRQDAGPNPWIDCE